MAPLAQKLLLIVADHFADHLARMVCGILHQFYMQHYALQTEAAFRYLYDFIASSLLNVL